MRRVWMVCLLTMVACSSRPPRRPEGLPSAAVWVGKGAKGRFIEIGARDGSVWTMTVFDAKGLRNPATHWRLQGFARTSLEPEEILGFQDGAILLNDDSRLVPAP